MSLMGTLAKVAIGVAVAKGASSLAKSGRSASGSSAGAGGLGDMMGAILGGGSGTGSVAGGLGGLLDELGGMGAGTTTSRRTATTSRRKTQEPDIGSLLGQLTGATGGSGSATGGIGDLIGSLATAGAAGGIGGLLGGMLSGGGLGSSLNSAFANGGEPDSKPAPAQELAAALLLKAMIQAAKADGQIDADEQQKLMAKLGEVTDAEKAFVQQELAAPVDVEGLARQIPEGLEAQAYTMSVMAIDLDSQAEAQYLHQFATALGLQPVEVNHIHDQLGVPKLYA
ncbi:MAG: DUF533 domain-containing protein [Paenirhodobacter sp.]|uniref:DUF533 domain-containing protein n=1 Tax=Paenirhodobacter sp. TaxID=1965326 RepID=UPI003D146A73